MPRGRCDVRKRWLHTCDKISTSATSRQVKHSRNTQTIEQRLSLWSANVFSGQTDAPSLNPCAAVEAHIPCILYHVLKPDDGRRLSGEVFVTRSSSFTDVRDHHLDIPIATKATFSGHFGNMVYLRTAVECMIDTWILVREAGKHRNKAWCLVGKCFNSDPSSIGADLIVDGDFRPFL